MIDLAKLRNMRDALDRVPQDPVVVGRGRLMYLEALDEANLIDALADLRAHLDRLMERVRRAEAVAWLVEDARCCEGEDARRTAESTVALAAWRKVRPATTSGVGRTEREGCCE